MKINRASEYAVRTILYLSGQGEGDCVTRREISEAMEIPGQFLGKIAQLLARAGFIEIVQGARGGYRLIRLPEEISLLDVIEAVTGEIFLNDCLLRPTSCGRSDRCTVHQVWQRARDQLRTTLGEAKFSSLLQSETCMDPGASDKRKKTG